MVTVPSTTLCDFSREGPHLYTYLGVSRGMDESWWDATHLLNDRVGVTVILGKIKKGVF